MTSTRDCFLCGDAWSVDDVVRVETPEGKSSWIICPDCWAHHSIGEFNSEGEFVMTMNGAAALAEATLSVIDHNLANMLDLCKFIGDAWSDKMLRKVSGRFDIMSHPRLKSGKKPPKPVRKLRLE